MRLEGRNDLDRQDLAVRAIDAGLGLDLGQDRDVDRRGERAEPIELRHRGFDFGRQEPGVDWGWDRHIVRLERLWAVVSRL